MYKETVTPELLKIAQLLSGMKGLESFRLVGGTAVSLQMGHRRSIDIDFFSNQKLVKSSIAKIIHDGFPQTELFISTESIRSFINGIRVELFDDWHKPFIHDPLDVDGIHMANLMDLAAMKLEAITGRREKKDYIDLYFLFNQLGVETVLRDFKNHNNLMSPKSILFALGEVYEAFANKSVMPEMLVPCDVAEVKASMIHAAQNYLALSRA